MDTGAFRKLMERLARAWNDQETPLALAFFTEDALYIEPPDLQRYRGHIALRLFFDDLAPGTVMRWHNLWFDEQTQRGAGEYSFRPGDWDNEANHGVAVVEMRGGKIAVWREYQRRGPGSFEEFLALEGHDVGASQGRAEPAQTTRTPSLPALRTLLERIPAISHVSMGSEPGAGWWVQFTLDIDSRLAWHVVQELASILNYLSLEERLPTVFKPISPPPYLNGGPRDYLSWVIECPSTATSAAQVAGLLESRLPSPVEDEAEWLSVDDEGEDEEDSDKGAKS